MTPEHQTGRLIGAVRLLQSGIACGVVGLALGACGGDGDEGGRGGTRAEQPAGDTTALKRRDPPPRKVKGQITLGSVGDGSCETGLGPPPRITFLRKFFSYQGDYDPDENDEPGRGDELWICLPGFSEREPAEAEIRAPDGKSYRRPAIGLPTFGVLTVIWDTRPSDPLGTYRVTVRQGSTEARSRFKLKPPTSPQIRVVGARHSLEPGGPPGTPFTTVLVGLRPRQRVRLDIYHRAPMATNSTYRYLTSVPVRLNARGEAIYTIKTDEKDSPGLYAVLTSVRGLVKESSPVFFELE